ncbi:ABC transporter ATP-binding protein, partial [Streptomyces sp. DT225]
TAEAGAVLAARDEGAPVRPAEAGGPEASSRRAVGDSSGAFSRSTRSTARGEVPPPIRRRPARGPMRPVRYELRRLFGVRTTTVIMAVVLTASAGLSVLLARDGRTPLVHVIAAWPSLLPLPPAALGAGLLGALS